MAKRIIKYSMKGDKYKALKLAFKNINSIPKNLTLKEQIVYYQTFGIEEEQ